MTKPSPKKPTPSKPTPSKPNKPTPDKSAPKTRGHELEQLKITLDTVLEENRKLKEQNELFSKRIPSLEQRLQESESIPPTPQPEPAPQPKTLPKQKCEVLIISDSIFRHVGGDCPLPLRPRIRKDQEDAPRTQVQTKTLAITQDIPYKAERSKPPLSVKKVVIPGARAPRLLAEASLLARTFNFEHIICHVGTNYVPYCQPDQAIFEINEFLDNLRGLFRDTRITWSPILPRLTPQDKRYPLAEEMMDKIHEINTEVIANCDLHDYDLMVCDAFVPHSDTEVPLKFLLAKDGCHLSRLGVVEMEHTLFEYINIFFGVSTTDNYT